MPRADVFIGYSHKDIKWKEIVTTFVSVMESAKQLSYRAWSDSDITPGAKWEEEIKKAIDGAKVALLLISADFLISEFIMEQEVPRIRERAENGQLVIIPFVVRPCPWEFFEWIRSTQGYVDNTKALSGQNEYNIELTLTELVREIGRIVANASIADSELLEVDKSLESEKVDKGWEKPTRIGPYSKDKFLTNAGVTRLIEDSVKTNERVVGLLRIFQTSKQQTWFVATEKHFYCVLDDEKTRAGGRQIQWMLALSDTEPIQTRTRANSKITGLINIGQKLNWMYSYGLHPDRNKFEETIRDLIESASAS